MNVLVHYYATQRDGSRTREGGDVLNYYLAEQIAKDRLCEARAMAAHGQGPPQAGATAGDRRAGADQAGPVASRPGPQEHHQSATSDRLAPWRVSAAE